MPRPRLSESIRQKLLDQGVEIFIERGYHGAGIKEILDEVGVPKGSFYNYFKSKEDFGAQVIRHFSGRFIDRLREAVDLQDGDRLEGLKRFFKSEIKCFEQIDCRKGCLIGNLGAELGCSSPCCREAMADSMDQCQQIIEQVVKSLQSEEVVRRDISAGDLAGLILNGWEGSLIRMKIEGSTEPLWIFCNVLLDKMMK